jgi:hypothetical protein
VSAGAGVSILTAETIETSLDLSRESKSSIDQRGERLPIDGLD